MFRVDIRFYNAHLRSRRETLGLSMKGMAERIGVSTYIYCGYENMSSSPIGKDGNWKPTALHIAGFWVESPEVLWPDAVIKMRKRKASIVVSKDGLRQIMDGKSDVKRLADGSVLERV